MHGVEPREYLSLTDKRIFISTQQSIFINKFCKGSKDMINNKFPFKRWHLFIIVILLNVFVASFVLRGILFQPGIVNGSDWGIPPTAHHAYNAIINHLYMWDLEGKLFGQSTVWSNSDLITRLITFVFITLCGSSLFSKLLILALLVLSAGSMYALCQSWRLGFLASFVAGLFYAYNPIFFNYSIAGWNTVLLAYSLLPFFPLVLKKALEAQHHFPLIRYALLSGLVLSGGALGGQVLISFLLVFLIFGFMFISTRTNALNYLKVGLISITVVVLINMFWIVPVVFFNAIVSSPASPVVIESYVSARTSQIDFVQLTRLWGSVYNLQFEYAYPRLLYPVTWIPSFFMAIVLLLHPRDRRAFFAAGLVLIPVFIFSVRYIVAESWFPYGLAFRDAGKFIYLVAFGYSISIALLIKKATSYKRINIHLRQFLAGLIIIVVLLNAFPFWNGDISGETVGVRDVRMKTLVFPQECFDVEEWLSTKDGYFKVLWLPTGSELRMVGNQDFYGIYKGFNDIFASLSSRPGRLRFEFPGDAGVGVEFGKFFLNAINHNRSNDYSALLNLANIKFVVVRLGMESFGITGDSILPQIQQQPNLQEVWKEGSIVVFENKMWRDTSVDPPALVIGDRQTLLTLGEFDKSMQYFFTEQLDQSQMDYLSKMVKTVILENGTWFDLVFSYAPRNRTIPPYYITMPSNVYMTRWLSNPELATSVSETAFISGDNMEVEQAFPLIVDDNETYQVWVKIYSGEASRPIRINVDNKTLATILPSSNINLGYQWFLLGNVSLNSGRHLISFITQEAAIQSIVVITEDEFKRAWNAANNFIENKHLIISGSKFNTVPITLDILNECSPMIVSEHSGLATITEKRQNDIHELKISGLTDDIYGQIMVAFNPETPLDITQYEKASLWIRLNNTVDGIVFGFNDIYNSMQDYILYKPIVGEWFNLIIPLNPTDMNPEIKLDKIFRIYFTPITKKEANVSYEIKNVDLIEQTTSYLKVNLPVYIPRTGSYSISFHISNASSEFPTEMSIYVNETRMEIERTPQGWMTTKNITLNTGTINFLVKGNIKFNIDRYLLEETGQAMRWVEPKLEWIKLDPTRFQVKVSTEEPFFLQLPEAFDLRWVASSNGKVFQHLISNSFSNAFLVNATGDFIVQIVYETQPVYEKIVLLSLFSAIAIPSLIVFLWFLERHHFLTYHTKIKANIRSKRAFINL